MTAAQADVPTDLEANSLKMPEGLRLDTPDVADGAAIWRIARDSKVLDLNSSYSYLLWCRDFAATSVVARDANGEPAGFITGYIRPERPRTLVVWQVAVDQAQRGRGLAGALLDGLTSKVAADRELVSVETTITPDNKPSERLFTSYAQRHGASVERTVLFDAGLFPEEGHEPEVLFLIEPVTESGKAAQNKPVKPVG
ncbi:diaminobutyrate acetyltransferase [Streptomyces sp. NPDC058257]|uniref:diaminobutyrate acetyltransferase n=1 Tax=Streptomyces sp. NPDC058257 TaxID=3346409 RepID=UPI0036E6DDD0